jgi:hypothetical protein
MSEYLDYYLNEARNGNRGRAFHGLIGSPCHLLPALEEAYRREADPAIRALIVNAVWQHRQASSVDFLAVAALDPHPEVWKQALDGLVTLASPESRKALELVKSRVAGEDAVLCAWIEEAIGQIDGVSGPGQ